MAHTLELVGHCPTKKNNYRRAAGRRLIVKPEIKKAIGDLILQAQSQWKRDPIERADLHAKFYVRDGRADLDGKFTTLQDVLVKARVLRNDSIARIRRSSQEAVIDPNERVVVEIQEAA